MKVALSTVALSAYNVIAKMGEPVEASRVFGIVAKGLEDPDITQEVFAKALAHLEAMNLLTIVDKDKGLVDVRDARRRVVRWRDRTGDGWNNWMVDDPRRPQPLAGV